MIWRPILAGVATLQEINTHWSIKDLIDCHEALDLKEDYEIWTMKQHEARWK